MAADEITVDFVLKVDPPIDTWSAEQIERFKKVFESLLDRPMTELTFARNGAFFLPPEISNGVKALVTSGDCSLMFVPIGEDNVASPELQKKAQKLLNDRDHIAKAVFEPSRECPCGIARVDCEYHRPDAAR